MIIYECPYCDQDISSDLNQARREKEDSYWAGFFICRHCHKEYRLILIEDSYVQIKGMNKKSYDKQMAANKTIIDRFGRDELKVSPPKKYLTWVNCVSDPSMNKYFSSKTVLKHNVDCAVDAISEAVSDAAIKIFKEQPQLASVKLMCYYITAAWTTGLQIHTIYNKTSKIEVEYEGMPEWNREHTYPITWNEEGFQVDVPITETPFV